MRGPVHRRIYRNAEQASQEPNMVGIGKNLWLDPAEPYKYINHSCSPNLGIKGKVSFVALRDIESGEQLTFDYSISEDSLWEMECLCGSENCRQVIRGIRHLPKADFQRLLPYIPRYFQAVYWNYQGGPKATAY